MKAKTISLAFALLICLGAVAAHAQDWCGACAETGDCWDCCRCNGGLPITCLHACGGPFMNAGLTASSPVPNLCPATNLQLPAREADLQAELDRLSGTEAVPLLDLQAVLCGKPALHTAPAHRAPRSTS
jgi:hypothetical protein